MGIMLLLLCGFDLIFGVDFKWVCGDYVAVVIWGLGLRMYGSKDMVDGLCCCFFSRYKWI